MFLPFCIMWCVYFYYFKQFHFHIFSDSIFKRFCELSHILLDISLLFLLCWKLDNCVKYGFLEQPIWLSRHYNQILMALNMVSVREKRCRNVRLCGRRLIPREGEQAGGSGPVDIQIERRRLQPQCVLQRRDKLLCCVQSVVNGSPARPVPVHQRSSSCCQGRVSPAATQRFITVSEISGYLLLLCCPVLRIKVISFFFVVEVSFVVAK